MPHPLTPKQEKFCQQFISTGNASEAYRQSYDCSRMKNTTINRAAHGLAENCKINARIGELQEEGRKRHGVTVSFADRAVTECLWTSDADGSCRSGSWSHLGVGKAARAR
ncbi:MAG TPA: hypothetical protein EYN93_10655 [Planctomycetaceae bacterium]|nr:hypothetical protein [Planctomycetaceae bacterium]